LERRYQIGKGNDNEQRKTNDDAVHKLSSSSRAYLWYDHRRVYASYANHYGHILSFTALATKNIIRYSWDARHLRTYFHIGAFVLYTRIGQFDLSDDGNWQHPKP